MSHDEQTKRKSTRTIDIIKYGIKVVKIEVEDNIHKISIIINVEM